MESGQVPMTQPVPMPTGGAPVPPEGGLNCKCCGPNTPVYVTKSITITGGLAAGLYSTNRMLYYDGTDRFRWHLIFFYLAALSILVLSAEFNLMRHRVFKAFAAFLSTCTGRGVTYIFIGGLMLLTDTPGLIIGICMMTAGVINMFAWCFFPELKDDTDKIVRQTHADAAARPRI
jgi:hypothetical protein